MSMLRERMKTLLLIALVATFSLLSAGAQQPATGTLGVIERLDPALDKLIPPGAIIEKLAKGFDWSEGPVWMPGDRCVLFSDVPRNTVYKWKAGAGVSVFLKPSGYTGQPMPGQREPGSNGLTLDAEGRPVPCEHGDRRVGRLEKDGRKTTLADRFEGKRLNRLNDLVFKSNGDQLLHRPALRPAETQQRSRQGTAIQWRLSAGQKRRANLCELCPGRNS